MTDIAPRFGSHGEVSMASATVDRDREFRVAARHTRLVKSLRVMLPAASALILIGYFAAVALQAGWHADVARVVLPRILPSDLSMHNPEYEGYSEDGSTYKFAAKSATPDLKNTDIIKLNAITGHLLDAKKSRTDFSAVKGVFNSKTGILELADKIDVDSADGMSARLTQATINTKVSSLISRQPVEVAFPAGTVRSASLGLRYKAKVVDFLHQVRANLNPPKPREGTANQITAGTATQPGLFSGSDQPVTITSKRFTIFDNEKRGTFTGDVLAVQGTATLTTPELEVSYESGQTSPSASDSAGDGAPGGMLASGKIRRVIAKGPVVMTQNKTDRVTSEAAEFDAINQTAILTGKVNMTSGPTRNAVSDRADLDQGNQTAILTGNVVVRQDKNVLRGRRLVVERAIGRTTLTSPPALGAGPGRISATFEQSGAKSKSSAPNESRPLGGFRTDPSKPLDVTADQLVVEDRKKQATFRGGVIAKQGTFKLQAAALTAFYSGSAALGDVASPAPAKGAGAQTNLKRIRADSKVVITGDQDQSVEGDWAEFDIAANKAVVGGDVRLKQNGAIIQGTRLTIDTKSGQSTIDTAPKNTVSKPSGGGWVTKNADGSVVAPPAGSRGRPSAVFFLNQLDPENGKKKPAAQQQKGTSSWEPRTAP